MKTLLFKSFSTCRNWEIYGAWIGASQSRKRRMWVAVRKSFLQNMESPACAPPISLNHFSPPSVISDVLYKPEEKDFPDGAIALIEPKFDEVHEPVLLGKISLPQNGSSVSRGDNDVKYYVYNTEGVAYSLGAYFPPRDSTHTIFFDVNYQKARTLNTLERWVLIGGDALESPCSKMSGSEYGMLLSHFNPPKFFSSNCHFWKDWSFLHNLPFLNVAQGDGGTCQHHFRH